MKVYKYNFCGCNIELKCTDPINPEGEFQQFLCDFSSPDYSFLVERVARLPEKTGETLYSSDCKKVFFDGTRKYYTAYHGTPQMQCVDLGCRIDDAKLYISHNGEIGEHIVFSCLDLPDLLLKKGVGIVHCSFIEHNGEAIVFVGDKQVGKSTQADLWQKFRGAEIINGDRAALLIENGRVFACGIPFCGMSKICKNKKLPVKAVVLLSKGDKNELSRLSNFEGFIDLLGKFSYNTWDKVAVDKMITLVNEIVETVSVFSYSCLKDKSAVDFLDKALQD